MERKLTILEEELDQLKVTSQCTIQLSYLAGLLVIQYILGQLKHTETWVLSTWCLGEIRYPTQGVNM